MFGNFQQAQLRLEIEATAAQIAESILHPAAWRHWIGPQRFSQPLPDRLTTGTVYTSWLGPLEIEHRVQWATDRSLCLVLAGAIDGYHERHWGDGWVQSSVAGVSVLPLRLGHVTSLWRLKTHLERQEHPSHPNAA
ncbi:MAG: hypothetical protein EA001_09715 [Oscillatoriales cyanobacterium]|nr:MAG: hypothetical protein EA001_09715 [Oscillatoriales cyanobacterium]